MGLANSTAVVNAAIQQIGDNQTPVTGTLATKFDNSAAGVAAAALYAQCVGAVGRQFGFDFSRNTVALAASGNVAPQPWSQEYIYPLTAIQIRQVMPVGAPVDPNNPLPVNWTVANTLVNGTPAKVIQCNLANAQAVITNVPPEPTWDPLFTEAVIRLLASELAMALEGRPETSHDMLEASAQFESVAERRDS